MLIQLLRSQRFAEIAPKRYKLAELSTTEQRLRQEALSLKPGLTFNDNASDLTRRHFGDFEVVRKLGVPEILERYYAEINKIGR